MWMEVDATSSWLQWVVFLSVKYKDLFIEGTVMTLYIAIVGTVIGFVLGYVTGIIQDIHIVKEDALLKRWSVWLLKVCFSIYVEIFRGTPMIVQGMIIYYGLRQSGVEISAVAAGILVIVLNTGAYMAETVRAGIKSIEVGQREGALAMGMSPMGAMLHVILPQALRNIMPEMGNLFLTNLKMTSVLNVIGISELFLVAKTAGGTYYKYYEAYLVIALIYLVLCFVFSRLFAVLEKKMAGKTDYILAAEYMNND